jgi:hypothetical protein
MTEISALEAYAGQISEAAQLSTAAAELQHRFVHGGVDEVIQTESGPLPSLAKWRQDLALLETLLADPNDPSKGVGKIPSAIRTVGTVAEMVAMSGWVAGQRVQTLGYYALGDGGANVYTVVAKGASVVDGGRFIATSNAGLLFRGEFINGEVRVKQFGAAFNVAVNDTLPFALATLFARTRGYCPVKLEPATILIDPWTPGNKDVLEGAGRGRSFIKGTAGTHVLKLSSKAVGVVTDRLDPCKDVKLRDFTVLADNADFGIYVNFGLFLDLDRITVWNAKVCNVFIAYCFGCDFGDLTYEYGKGTGLEFGNNRFGWPNIVGESPVLNHGNCIRRARGYSNGLGLVARPATVSGAIDGAGSVWGPGFVNDIGLVYNELNNGTGVVVLPGMGYTLAMVYNEKNDNLALPADTRTEVYANSSEASIGDVFTEYGGNHAVWNANVLCINNHRGVQLNGPGFVKITGLYKGTYATNPRLVPLLIFSAKGNKLELTNSFTLPANLPPESSRQYERSGAYRMYPEVTIEDAATLTAGPNIRIYKKSDGTSVYNGTLLMTGAQTAGTRVKLPALDFLWDPAETYRIQFYGLDGYAGRVGISLYVEVMV